MFQVDTVYWDMKRLEQCKCISVKRYKNKLGYYITFQYETGEFRRHGETIAVERFLENIPNFDKSIDVYQNVILVDFVNKRHGPKSA